MVFARLLVFLAFSTLCFYAFYVVILLRCRANPALGLLTQVFCFSPCRFPCDVFLCFFTAVCLHSLLVSFLLSLPSAFSCQLTLGWSLQPYCSFHFGTVVVFCHFIVLASFLDLFYFVSLPFLARVQMFMCACKNHEPIDNMLEREKGGHSKTAGEQSRLEQGSGEERRTQQSKAEQS